MIKKLMSRKLLLAGVGATLLSVPAAAEVSSETAYIFNTLLFLMGGFLVMWMAAGFAMLEAGLVRSKNVGEICLKNIALYGVACVMFLLVGYNMMYAGVDGGYFGTFSMWVGDDSAALAETGATFDANYAAASDFFFQVVFVATAASVVSGTVAERIKLFPFLLFTVVLTGLIYPIQGSWEWGGGWLNGESYVAAFGSEFADFAGSTLVHSTGGWAALVGAIILGPRIGKYTADGKVRPMPGSSMPLATLGTFILWVGWFGFNGSSQLALGSAADAIGAANVYLNTNMAACGGLLAAMFVTKAIYKKVDLSMVLNGALAGLVSITAGPDTPTPLMATLIGFVGGVLVVFAVPFVDKLKIDDAVGAISVHLVCGIWGTLAVAITNPDITFMAQLVGVVAIGAFVSISSAVVWLALKYTVGIRLSAEHEELGSDLAELGLEAYPEFGKGSQKLSF